MYVGCETPHFREIEEFDEDVSAMCQSIVANGYLQTDSTVFADKFNYSDAMPAKSKRVDIPPAKAKPKSKYVAPINTKPKQVFDFAAYKTKRLAEIQPRAEEDQAAELIRLRRRNIHLEMVAKQEKEGKEWALQQLDMLIPAIKELKNKAEMWQARKLEGRVDQLRTAYSIF